MNIAIYGFMGVGKTTIGALLARKLSYSFVDMDTEIEKRESSSIYEIFSKYGETRFRELESKLLIELLKKENIVIACGGGTLANPENAEKLKNKAILVYLTASINEILHRTSIENTRPLLDVTDPYSTALKLLNSRKPVYEKYAEITVDTTDKTPESIVSKIMELLE
jgi:shikimate kinase